jgi:hypothetical protein
MNNKTRTEVKLKYRNSGSIKYLQKPKYWGIITKDFIIPLLYKIYQAKILKICKYLITGCAYFPYSVISADFSWNPLKPNQEL